MTKRIAAWSGPRNISTALMRSWENRLDTRVIDEPLYGHYLAVTGRDHPGADEIMAAQETDWRKVVEMLRGPVPQKRDIWYQKHMAHHFLPGMDLDWLDGFEHVFLIREPREMLTSLIKVIPEPTVEETGLPQQVAIFDRVCADSDEPPPVIVARDVLEDPAGMLEALCAALDVPFTESMLTWPAGPRSTDGVWAPYWYANVEKSTGFAPYEPKSDVVPPEFQDVLDACEPLYAKLIHHRLTA